MPDIAQFLTRGGEYFVLLRGNIHFLRPKMFAEIWVHGLEISDWLNG